MPSVKHLAIRGAVWTFIGYGSSQVLRFGSNLALTRLLVDPKFFGLMALVNVFISGLHMFSDVGIGPSLIRNQREDPDFDNTAWTMQIVRGLGIWICCLAIALPASQFYKEPELLFLLPVASLSTVIGAFNSTGIYALNRRLSVKELAIFELLGQVISVSVMIVWAYFNKSVWALVAGSLTGAVFQLFLSHRLNPGTPNRLAWDAKASREIFSFGKWIFISTLLTFIASQMDRPVLGKLLGFELLGVYGIALALADIPKALVFAIGDKVVFPVYAKYASLPRDEFRGKVERSRRLILFPAAIGLALLVGLGDVAVSILYPNRFADAAWIMPILAVGIWPVILNTTLDQTLYAIGKIQFVTLACFVSGVFLIGGMLVGYQVMGTTGAIIAVPFSNIPPYFIITYGLWREKLTLLKQDVMTTALFLALLAVVMGGRILLGFPPPLPGLH